jgi:acyl carrier protein
VTPADIYDQIARIIAKFFNIPVEGISRESVANEIEGWDSLQHVYLIMEVEAAFSIRMPTQSVFGLRNVGDLCDLIEKTLS